MMYLGMYLTQTKVIGIKFKILPNNCFERYAYADFADACSKGHSDEDHIVAKSRSGWHILYAGFPVIWASNLQTIVALSITEVEYIALSNALHDVIPIMELVKVMKSCEFYVISILLLCIAKYLKTILEQKLAHLPKVRSRTKHIAVCYHHFKEHICAG